MKRHPWLTLDLTRDLRRSIVATCPDCFSPFPSGRSRCSKCKHVRPEVVAHAWLISPKLGLCTVTGRQTDVRIPGGHFLWLPLFLHSLVCGWLDDLYAPRVDCPFRSTISRYPHRGNRVAHIVSPEGLGRRFDIARERLRRLALHPNNETQLADTEEINSCLAMAAILKSSLRHFPKIERGMNQDQVVAEGMDWIRVLSQLDVLLTDAESKLFALAEFPKV